MYSITVPAASVTRARAAFALLVSTQGGVIPDGAALRDLAQDAAVPLHREQAVLLHRPPQGVGQLLEIGFFGHMRSPSLRAKCPF